MPERLLPPWLGNNARRDTTRMSVYYAASVLLGIGTIWGDPAPVLTGALGHGWRLWVFGGSYALLGAAARAGRLRSQWTIEALAVRGLAIATFVHGAIGVEDGAILTGLRLIIAPLMMWSYAATLTRWHITRADVAALSQDRDQ